MHRSHPQVRDILPTIGGGACAMGAVGGITGMLAGFLAPGILTGFYALDGPEPSPTFSPVIWGSQKGLIIGLLSGAGGAILALPCLYLASWRPRMTTSRIMIWVAVIAVLLGMIRWNAALLLSAGLATFIPSFAWADTGGRLRRCDPARPTLERCLRLFAWAWLLSTMGLYGAVCLVSLVEGIRLVKL